ncbi:Sorting nexin, cytoplasm-to-vacuole targeting pathway/endosomal sorting [Sorochytrium milnesiophthora]
MSSDNDDIPDSPELHPNDALLPDMPALHTHVASSISQRNASTPGFCCNIEVALDNLKQQLLSSNGGSEQHLAKIVDAQKTHDGAGSSYIAYIITYGDKELKRRYSEFNSLRKCLHKIYPTVIVPPIPEKHSMTDYATKQNRAKQDPFIIDKRKRMLQSFLNRIIWHPILSTEHIFHRFLEPGILWSDILHSAKVTSLPKAKSTNSLASSITQSLVPSSSPPAVKHVDPKFVEAETFTNKFENHVKDVLEKTQKKVLRKYYELAKDYSELGATYNALSLNEAPQMAASIEKVGQAMDTNHIATCQNLEEQFAEPLHEYSQFSDIIKAVLRYRQEQQAAYEHVCDTLEFKRTYLDQLEKAEAEAQRLEEALKKEGYNSPRASKLANSAAASISKGNRGLVGTISDKINSFMDADPETTRKHNIAKTKDVIAQLEEQKEKQSNDVVQISAAVQQDLDRFQRQKLNDFKHMLIEYAKAHADYCRRNLQAWEEAKQEVGKITSS